jgi:hypothetical protein
MIKKFEETGSIMDSKLPVRHHGWSLDKIAAVSESVAESPGTSICNMITEFLWPQMDGMDMEDMWFQHDGATCHTVHKTTELLQEKFLAVSSHTMAIRIGHRCCAI